MDMLMSAPKNTKVHLNIRYHHLFREGRQHPQKFSNIIVCYW